MRGIKRILGLGLLAIVLFWAPWLYLAQTTEIEDFETVEQAETAIVFGALVRNGAISPLHEERLLSAKRLHDEGLVDGIVLSNSARATGLMVDYMKSAGVQETALELDIKAIQTADTCDREQMVGAEREVILISQSFHLPRLAYQCKKRNVVGQYLAAEMVHEAPRVNVPFMTKLRVRGKRYVREAALTWAVVLGIYERI